MGLTCVYKVMFSCQQGSELWGGYEGMSLWEIDNGVG